MKYTIKDFHKQYRDDADCLEYVYRQKYPEGATCLKCGKVDSFYPVKGRRAYACMCGHQIHPTVGTIFHKSPTSLKTWFFAMFLLTVSKNGVAAKELERQLGVTYKCAWRMAHQIRHLLQEGGTELKGVVEADETYIGGKCFGVKGPTSGGRKTPVIGIVERGGRVAAKVVTDVRAKTVLPHIFKHVHFTSTIYTDENYSYKRLTRAGFKHESVTHSAREYVRGMVHTNTIEGFWSQIKRSINGTFHSVSRKHLQKYVNEFAYRYNRRKSEMPMFLHLIPSVGTVQLQAL